MKQTAAGFILFSALMILSMIALLVVSQLQTLLGYRHLQNRWDWAQQQFHDLEHTGLQLVARLKEAAPEACVSNMDEPNGVIDLLQSGQGCRLSSKDQDYRYQFEDLGVIACMQTIQHHALLSTHHWRLTLLPAVGGQRGIQWHLATSSPLAPCAKQGLIIPVGILSWRLV